MPFDYVKRCRRPAGGKEAEVKYLLLLQRGAGEDLPEFGTPEATAVFRKELS